MSNLLASFEDYLSTLISEDHIVEKAMNYSYLAKSKRVRPLLLLHLLEDFQMDPTVGFPAAAAIEMVHTYSLIHDDLPAFDNDDFRRGRPSNHKVFGEEVAILAGDGLLTYAFELLAKSDYDDAIKVRLIALLTEYAGKAGMIRGQALDMQYETQNVTVEDLKEMDDLKTGRLITVPMLMACVIAGKEQYASLFQSVGSTLGLAFQIQDDLLDVYSSQEVTGKSNSDEANHKSTYLSLMGQQKTQQFADALYDQLENQLKEDYPHLYAYMESLQKRVW